MLGVHPNSERGDVDLRAAVSDRNEVLDALGRTESLHGIQASPFAKGSTCLTVRPRSADVLLRCSLRVGAIASDALGVSRSRNLLQAALSTRKQASGLRKKKKGLKSTRLELLLLIALLRVRRRTRTVSFAPPFAVE